MLTNDERREVARQLTEAAERVSKDDDIACVLNDILRGDKKRRGTNEDCTVCRRATFVELADLIDPDTTNEQTNHDESSLSASPIDRDALLVLADEIDRKSDDGTVNPDPTKPIASSLDLFGYARRIREAVGE